MAVAKGLQLLEDEAAEVVGVALDADGEVAAEGADGGVERREGAVGDVLRRRGRMAGEAAEVAGDAALRADDVGLQDGEAAGEPRELALQALG